MRIAIIGAGAAGMIVAYSLVNRGGDVNVYEPSSEGVGLAPTRSLWNQKIDVDSLPFLSTDKQVKVVCLEVVGNDYEIADALTRTHNKNKFFNYLLKTRNVLENLVVLEARRCVFSYVGERIFPIKQDGSFELCVQRRLGKRLYEVFFKKYTEKLWGISSKELDADFAAQQFKKFSMFEAICEFFTTPCPQLRC